MMTLDSGLLFLGHPVYKPIKVTFYFVWPI